MNAQMICEACGDEAVHIVAGLDLCSACRSGLLGMPAIEQAAALTELRALRSCR